MNDLDEYIHRCRLNLEPHHLRPADENDDKHCLICDISSARRHIRMDGLCIYCPQCGRHLKAATGTVKGSEEKRYRFKCVDRMHYRTKWHESYQAALMEMIETFEKGENA